ncbi:hypothetical protein ENSA5_23000 [Enhygromyxa salina]|uniref:Tetratricopeptide repeat protein n=1 Tax=Enhygromyxa salina TaxID=215803 RepID=A0A2S9YBP5_9BACT|nr:tetratricopeptide repeat protein [Enhygromyxa salina]PRQ02482.1 hypothetical protein ENSA5_23000 [Enhygromyxa salina]
MSGGEADELVTPGLRRFVEAAREQPITATRVTAEAVLAGLEQERRRTQGRRTLMLSAALALAASIAAIALLSPLLSDRKAGAQELALDPDGAASKVDAEGGSGSASLDGLAHAIRLRSSSTVEVRGPWSIALGEGVHELEVRATPGHALRVSLPDRELELVEGSATIEIVEGSAALRLHTGVAAWVDAGAAVTHRTAISVEHIEEGAPEANSPEPSAAVLAREADSLLVAGKRDEAIGVLRRLVLEHPHASQTRAAVLDLGRLLRNAKRGDEARCAYELYLHRWPGSAVEGEVHSLLEGLGPGRDCRGLTPR